MLDNFGTYAQASFPGNLQAGHIKSKQRVEFGGPAAEAWSIQRAIQVCTL